MIAASGGNFGLAVAFAAHELEHRAEIFVPETSPKVKIDRIRALGAEVIVVPGYYADAAAACEERALETAALFMHPYDQFEVVAGQGTIGMELSEQCPGADTVMVAVGGGGLVGGVAAWYANEARVVGVEPETSPTMSAALAAGGPVDVEVYGVAADSLGAASGRRSWRTRSATDSSTAWSPCRTRRSTRRSGACGGTCTWWRSPARRRRWPRCWPARTTPSPTSGSSSSCAARTRTSGLGRPDRAAIALSRRT